MELGWEGASWSAWTSWVDRPVSLLYDPWLWALGWRAYFLAVWLLFSHFIFGFQHLQFLFGFLWFIYRKCKIYHRARLLFPRNFQSSLSELLPLCHQHECELLLSQWWFILTPRGNILSESLVRRSISMIFCCQIAPNTASSFYFAIAMGM